MNTEVDERSPSNGKSYFTLNIWDHVFEIVIPLLIMVPQQVAEIFSQRTVNKILSLAGLGTSNPNGPKNKLHLSCDITVTTISKHIQLVRPHKAYLCPNGKRRVVLFYAWLTAKPRHISKYSKLITDLGIDFLAIRTFPLDAMAPTTGSQIVAEEVVEFLKSHKDYEQYAVYACSIGAYVFCETVLKMRKEPVIVNDVIPKFVGQLYDSAVDFKQASIGVATTITNNATLQRLITSYINWYLNVREESVTKHYRAAAEVMYESPLRCPTFYTYAINDTMTPSHCIEGIAQRWRDSGLEMSSCVFDQRSGHCLNFPTYPHEYKQQVYTFMKSINMTANDVIEKAASGKFMSCEKQLLKEYTNSLSFKSI